MAAKSIFITELYNGIECIFQQRFWGAESYIAIRFIHSLSTAFLNSDISQGSVATFVRCGGMFGIDVIANLLTSLPVKEVRKSVLIWRRY